ncbi:restriction endonuclease subunit S [Paracnuella aquatica]
MRFKGFKDEWEVKKLGDMVEFKAGYAFKSEQMLSEKSTYQLIKMSNVYQNELRLIEILLFGRQLILSKKSLY